MKKLLYSLPIFGALCRYTDTLPGKFIVMVLCIVAVVMFALLKAMP